jgi:aspartyl protease family protein
VVVEVGGKRMALRVGDAPASVGSNAGQQTSGSRVVLTAGPGGHFTSEGQINGRVVRFIVDTGATAVSMGVAEAERIGLKYQNGDRVQMSTANGVVQGWKMTLDNVRLGDVLVGGVDAIVSPVSMPYVLLGNSFLSRFQMNRTNDQMVLERRF